MAYAWINPLPLTEGRLLERENELAYWCMFAILYSLFFLPDSLFLLYFCYFLFFLSSFTFFSVLTHVVMLWFSPNGYYCRDDDTMHNKGFFIYCLPWLVFTILTFNYFCLVWVFQWTTTGLSAVQPLPLTRTSRVTSHHQTKKIILGVLIHHSVGVLSLFLMLCT